MSRLEGSLRLESSEKLMLLMIGLGIGQFGFVIVRFLLLGFT